MENVMEDPQKHKTIKNDPAISLLGMQTIEMTNLYPPLAAMLLEIANIRKQPKCLSMVNKCKVDGLPNHEKESIVPSATHRRALEMLC